eukprot:1194610-Prorocentrum_minimum.AAC.11
MAATVLRAPIPNRVKPRGYWMSGQKRVCHAQSPPRTTSDHKAVGEGDVGPNTGGMGAYSPAPVVTPEIERIIIEDIVQPTVDGMAKEGVPFQGVLFAGLMIENGKPRLLEYNVRFGDPECQVREAIARRIEEFTVRCACAEGHEANSPAAKDLLVHASPEP